VCEINIGDAAMGERKKLKENWAKKIHGTLNYFSP
jgi:hypothetical protein